MKQKHLWILTLSIVLIISVSIFIILKNGSSVDKDTASLLRQKEKAKTTPYGKYPELVEYTLGKMTGTNNSNMPEGDTYEDNAYTRYLKEMLNIQNIDLFEATDRDYDNKVSMAVKKKELPDIMVVSDQKVLQELVEKDMIQDLTEVYENCTSDKIKEMYSSYGNTVFDDVTFDGKLMAFPETNIDDGPNLLWLRKDWLDKLDLEEPKTMEDVEYIISQFIEYDPGKNGEGNTVGLICDPDLTGENGYRSEYQIDILFAKYNAYPKQWIYDDDGQIVYGSIQPEVKKALVKLHEMYQKDILDNQFLVRTTSGMIDLVIDGKCGSFFGPWWAPNNPLMDAKKKDPSADWVPYMIETSDGVTRYYPRNPSYKYVVVRKGYEYPEIVPKMISVMFDYIKYEDKEAKGLVEYFKKNVDPTARPISINIDYKDALDRCYADVTAALDEIKDPEELPLLEYSYYEACKDYLENSEADVEDWAAYASRISACSLFKLEPEEIDAVFFTQTETMEDEWWQLLELEKDVYLKIIIGEEPIEYFDEFVKQWKTGGGDRITEEVRGNNK